MNDKMVLTTGKVAAHCHISPDTVINWIKDGKLKAYTTLGGHRRVHVSDFRAFLTAYGLPPYEDDPSDLCKVLVVDDEPDVVQLITRNLQEVDRYVLQTAVDGFDAGLMVSKFKPDLILLDLMMPNIDGFKICKRIRSNPETEHIGILIITGYNAEENIQKALASGADDYLVKPFKLPDLLQKVDALNHKRLKRTAAISRSA